MAVAVLGDVGAQTEVYREALLSIGINPDTCIIPDGIDLIQVGDVVRMNPHPDLDSLGCAQISDKLLNNNSGRFHQLLGNHDLALLGGALDPMWKIDDLPESRPYVEQWWQDKTAKLGVALKSAVSADDDVLITHAGLGFNYWTDLGAPNATGAAETLNELVGTTVADFENPGWLVTRDINVFADTAWALVGPEFHNTWKGKTMPFNQIHGHATLMQWDKHIFWHDVTEDVINSTVVDFRHRYTMTYRPDGRWIRSVDWVLGNETIKHQWPVFILPNHAVV